MTFSQMDRTAFSYQREKTRFDVNTVAQTKGVVPITDSTVPKKPEPIVFYTPAAFQKMQLLVDICDQEVGWMCMVLNPKERVFVIYDIIVPEQVVSGAETDISQDSMAGIVDEVLEKTQDGAGVYAWYHSHVNMGVSPSPQDEYQVAQFLESCPVFIRGIMNKKGQAKVDVYFRDEGVAYTCVNTNVLWDGLPQSEIDLLRSQVKQRVKRYTPPALNTRKLPGRPVSRGGIKTITHPAGPGTDYDRELVWGDGDDDGDDQNPGFQFNLD